jgi:membrane fusion protein, multidrug efflux system
MMTEIKKRGRIKSSHVIAVLLAVGAFLWVASGMVAKEMPTETEVEDLPEQKVILPLVRVRQSTALPRVREVTLFGRTEAINQADIAAETSGRIIRKSVEKGQFVKKGDVILNIDIDDRRAKLEEAEAEVDYQEIAYNASKKLSTKQFQSRVKLAESLANLEKAKASLLMIKIEINRTVIRAPISGYINELELSVGDYLKSGDVVASIVDLNPLRIVGQVSERDVSKIQQDEVAHARLPDGQEVAGTVRYVSRTGSETTRTFRVDIWIDNPDGAISEGLTAEIRLPTEQQIAHLVSPAVLTLNEDGIVGVKSVDDDGVVQFHAVTIVSDTTEGVWLGGLPVELTLITVGQEFVRPGQPVRTSDEDSGDVAGSVSEAKAGS